MFYCISDIRIFKSKTRFPIKSTQCCQGLDCSQCPYFSVRWSRRSASGGYLDRLSIYKGGGARLVAGFAELVEFLEYAASLRMIQFKAKKRLIRQDNGETALHRAAKGSHPSSLNSIVLSPVWIPSPSLRLHTGPGLQTKTLAHEDVPCAKSHMTWKIVMPTRKSPWNKGSPSYRRKRSVMLVTARIISRRTAQKREHVRNAKGHTPLYSI